MYNDFLRLSWPCCPDIRIFYSFWEEKMASLDVWDLPIWYLPILQLINHGRYARDINIAAIRRIRASRNLQLVMAGKPGFRAGQTKEEAREKKKEATIAQSRLESDFLKAKMMEAFFESGPQIVLQLSIILKQGHVHSHQIATIVFSFLKMTMTATQLHLTMPTVNTLLRSYYLKDIIVLLFPSLFIIASRLGCWSLTVAYLETFTLLVILVSAGLQFSILRKQIDFKSDMDIIGVFVNVLLPCIVKDEYSRFYQKSNAISSLTLLMGTCLVFIIPQGIEMSPPISTCFEVTDWEPAFNQTRCFFDSNSTRISQECISYWVHIDGFEDIENYRTVCRSGMVNPLYVLFGISAMALIISSFLAHYFLQKYIDPLKRLCYVGTWNKFYSTKKEDVLSFCEDEMQSGASKKDLILSAIDDNIDSLLRVLMTQENVNELLEDRDMCNTVLEKMFSSGSVKLCRRIIKKLKRAAVKREQNELLAQQKIIKIIEDDNRNFKRTLSNFACSNENHFTFQLLFETYQDLLSKCPDEDEVAKCLHLFTRKDSEGFSFWDFAASESVLIYSLEKYGLLVKEQLKKNSHVNLSQGDLDSVKGSLDFLQMTGWRSRTALNNFQLTGVVLIKPILREHFSLSKRHLAMTLKGHNTIRIEREAIKSTLEFLEKSDSLGQTVAHVTVYNWRHDLTQIVLREHALLCMKMYRLFHGNEEEVTAKQMKRTREFLERKDHNGESVHRQNLAVIKSPVVTRRKTLSERIPTSNDINPAAPVNS